MGFDRAFPPGTRMEAVIETLNCDFSARAAGQKIANS
jgi:methylmalonyl-CoA mutase cobalamin-binding subunit